MNKIRVLHIITRLDKGGSADNTLFTVSNLNKDKFDVMLLSGKTHDPDNAAADFIRQNKVNYRLIPELIREISPRQDIKAFWKIFNFIKKGKFDIVHTHTSKAGILGRWAAKLAGVKVIVHTPHGHIFYGYFGRVKTGLFVFLEKITALITDKIITLTNQGKEEHIKFKIANPRKFIPIYSGIEIDKFAGYQLDVKKEKEKLNLLPDAPVIGTVCRLEPVKGVSDFIAALPEVVNIFPGLKVFIAGDGSEREILHQQAGSLNLLKNIIFMGPCSDVRYLLSIFDVFVLSSLNEGMGRSLIEAQALGVPVVATKVGGVPEVVKDGLTGILVPARNPKKLAKAIINLLKDKALRKNMSGQARKWADEKFSARVMVEKIAGVYRELLNGNN